ncbi:hypothetical protein TNCT_146331 [Trichonephila clavata]|uniref:Uncharacterized protein n=1 Tax=Trichonephila clavata TaxID=2740835 RepID=A0A8X6H3C1_TRICU|nr:hypothetical protein TNCT_146331 [Trichonephila clavata]
MGCLLTFIIVAWWTLTKLQQGNNSAIKAVNGNTKFHQLLTEFPSLVEAVSTPRKLKHSIVTRGPTVFSKPRLHPD